MSKDKRLDPQAEQPPIPGEDAPLPAHGEASFQMMDGRMPIGILSGGELHKGYEFRRYNMGVEREVSAARARNRHPGAYVPEVLSALLTRLGPHDDFQSLSDAAKRLIVSQMWMPDVMFLYFQARREALGDELRASIACPACGHRFVFEGDLSQADVTVAQSPASLSWHYRLRHGLIDGEGQVHHDVILQHPRWSAMMSLSRHSRRGKGTNPVDVRIALARSSLRQVGDGSVQITDAMLDDMTKLDMEGLQKELDQRCAGPDLTLEAECTALSCGHEFKIPVNWDWDFFFTAASL